MNKSILRNLFIAYMLFGILMGSIFPFYADFFVEWKEGMYVWFVTGCLVAGIVMGLVAFSIMKLLLLKELEKIAEVASAISEKDLTLRCDVESDDLIGNITGSFDIMVKNLQEVITELKAHCADIDTSVSEVASVAADSAQSTDMQFNEVTNIQGSIHQLQESIVSVGDNTTAAMELCKESSGNVKEGNQIVHQTMEVITQLSVNIKEATETIDTLKSETQNIDSVLAAIQGISEQTNLLALNAAIEAARAGEQGRGFAVVADEVRTLAKRTHDATHEIQTMIESLQNGASSAVNLMDRSTEDASKGVEIISKAGSSLDAITQAMSEMNKKSIQIKESADHQLQAVDRIHENIKSVSFLTANSQKGSLESANESEKLRVLTAKLVQIFDEFKIDSSAASSMSDKAKEAPIAKVETTPQTPHPKPAVVEKQQPVSEELFSDDDDVLF